MRSLGCTGFFGGLLVVVLAVTLAGELTSSGPVSGGVTDHRRAGRAFARGLLERAGLEPGVWTGRPAELVDAPVELLWLPDLPPEYRAEEPPLAIEDWESWEEPTPVVIPRTETSFSASHYADFVARGGDVVVPVLSTASLDFAEDLLGLERSDLRSAIFYSDNLPTRTGLVGLAPVEGVTLLELFQDREGTVLGLELDPERGLANEALYVERELLVEPDADRSGGLTVDTSGPSWGYTIERVLPGDLGEDESPFAVVLSADAGRVVLLSGDDAFENEAALTADHALVLVRFAELLERRIWFDESVLRPSHGSWMGYLLRPPFVYLTLSLLVLAILAGMRSAARRGFPLEERLAHGPTPLERARGRAGLLLAAGRQDLLAADLIDGVLARLGVTEPAKRSARDRRSATGDDADSRASVEATQLLPRLAAVAPAPPGLASALETLGLGPEGRRPVAPPTTTAELEQLGRTLADIEERIHLP
ncbi:MAG: hypothetical protein P1V81_03580 [Planctomycetota bacterium]|nr:hypothetical protein [Planctomycetota bacterium]